MWTRRPSWPSSLPRLQVDVGGEHPFALLADEADRWTEDVPRRYAEAGEPFERSLLDARSTSTARSTDRRPGS